MCTPVRERRMRDPETAAPTNGRQVTAPTRPRDETAHIGDKIYQRDIKSKVEADHHGEIVAIDVDSGIWAVGEDITAARERLRRQRPEAVNVLFERVGYRAIDSFGAGFLRGAE